MWGFTSKPPPKFSLKDLVPMAKKDELVWKCGLLNAVLANVCVCVWACMCLTAALSPAAKGSSGETHPLLFALHREDCFQRVFRKGNPSIVASVDPYQFFLYVFLHRHISSTDFDFHTAAILKFLPSPFFSPPLSIFVMFAYCHLPFSSSLHVLLFCLTNC